LDVQDLHLRIIMALLAVHNRNYQNCLFLTHNSYLEERNLAHCSLLVGYYNFIGLAWRTGMS